jgi:hypothetical protein
VRQQEAEARLFIEGLTGPGALVVDPYAGGGAFLPRPRPRDAGGWQPSGMRRRPHLLEVLPRQQRVAVKPPAGPEVVQVAVGPGQRLALFVELVQGAVLRLDAPPDRGPGAEQGDPELVDSLGGDGTEATGAVEALGRTSVTCRSELRTIAISSRSVG